MNKDVTGLLKIFGITIGIVFIAFMSTGSESGYAPASDIGISSFIQFIILILSALFIVSLIASIITAFKNKVFVKILFMSFLLLISFGSYIFAMVFKVNK